MAIQIILFILSFPFPARARRRANGSSPSGFSGHDTKLRENFFLTAGETRNYLSRQRIFTQFRSSLAFYDPQTACTRHRLRTGAGSDGLPVARTDTTIENIFRANRSTVRKSGTATFATTVRQTRPPFRKIPTRKICWTGWPGSSSGCTGPAYIIGICISAPVRYCGKLPLSAHRHEPDDVPSPAVSAASDREPAPAGLRNGRLSLYSEAVRRGDRSGHALVSAQRGVAAFVSRGMAPPAAQNQNGISRDPPGRKDGFRHSGKIEILPSGGVAAAGTRRSARTTLYR